ncbi:Serine/threonine-protein kinase Sgk2 [Kickxella alabastrina]|uniref:Serine/threonine-protein kinase Sgk2 n=1 Tax=Kickxella alabastrina TaxID=61397 RepID=A0ACC1ILJ1_9FUNG|nr:Serine/threonine-protein kinase Sgk2 [Kickxella alabastrina]
MHANLQHYPQHSQPAPSTISNGQRTLIGGNPVMPASRPSLEFGTRFHATAGDNSGPNSGRASVRQGSGSSTGGGIGSWFSKYSLRGSRPAATSTASTGTTSTINTVGTTSSEYARHSIDSTLAALNLGTQAFAALITGIETSEQQVPESPTSHSVGSRVGQKQYVAYRILVSGREGQWWAIRQYSEFYDLYAALRRRSPQLASRWAELFPVSHWGMTPTAEMAAQWATHLNAFLRAVTGDTDVCPCDDVQKFLREAPGSLGCLSPAADAIASPGASPRVSSSRMPLPGNWSSQPARANAAMERISMPVLKHQGMFISQTITPPTITPRRITPIGSPTQLHMFAPVYEQAPFARQHQQQHHSQLPMVPPRPNKHQSMGMDNSKQASYLTVSNSDADSQAMLRKASDSLLYLSAEKRPNMEPLTMRKKYGLRGNLQYVNDSHANLNEQGPEPRESISSDYEEDIYEEHTESKISSNAAAYRDITPMANQPPSMLKSKTWGALQAKQSQQQLQLKHKQSKSQHKQQPSRGSASDAMDVDAGARDASATNANGRPIQQAQLFHQQRQMGPAVVKGTVNTLMSTLATEPPRTAPAHIQQFGSDSQADTGGEVLAPGMKRVGLDDFHLLSIIGKGSYGKVMLARYKDTGKVMAIKVISKSKLRGRPNEIRRVMSERKVLERTVEHPFLVGLQCAFQTKEKLFFCLDYVNGGELFFHLQRERRFSENRSRFYAAEITCAIEYLHGMGVVYRDLKPENCLLDADGHVKIVDFGLAKEVGPVVWRTEGSALYSVEEGGKTGTFCGTPEYLAPEVLLRQRYGKEVDWYCLGAVLFEMLTGLPPFYDQDNNIMYRRILHEPLRFPTSLPNPLRGNGTYNDSCGIVPGAGVGKLAQDFITRILERDPQKRLGNGVFGTENVKRHPFFHGIEWPKIHRQEYAPPFVPKVSSIFDLSNIDPEFRNEPIPESILAEGQVDIIAEAAEAERQAELAMQAQLSAFPSPMSTPATAANASGYFQHQQARMGANPSHPLNSLPPSLRNSYGASEAAGGDAFQGFSFVSPWVDMPDDQ